MIESNFLHIFAHSVIKTVRKTTVCTKGGLYVKDLALFCFLNFRIGGDSINGNYFTLPNKIFDEGLTPNEFVVYSFLTKAKDKKNQSYWSVPNIAHYCGICENSCRKAIKSLTDKGYVDVTKRYLDNAQQSNIYTVRKI